LPAVDQFTNTADVLTSSIIKPDTGYIRFNDSLANNSTIEAFDRALKDLRNTRNLIIDLRNTPSGGNTSVARGILGRFVNKERPYQKHVLPSEEKQTGVHRSWLELVSPRGEFQYTRPVAVIVNRWTGSMGEGLAIGFDATIGSKIVGTPMAGLLGATTRVTLPRTGIGINVPTERLYDVNGKPREEFRPDVLVDVTRAESNQDPYIAAALRAVSNTITRKDLGK
jgi:carboxyl-terminal processing protease